VGGLSPIETVRVDMELHMSYVPRGVLGERHWRKKENERSIASSCRFLFLKNPGKLCTVEKSLK